MWRAFASLAALALLPFACAPRNLSLALTVDAAACNLSLPAGGSILYQLSSSAAGDGGGGSFCGGCLAVDAALAGPDALVAFLRARSPACGAVHPGTTLAVRVTGFGVAGCPPASAPAFCADAPSQLVPDGTGDATLSFALVCKPQCATVCVPTTCAAQGKNCGSISDGCNAVLNCGTCAPPLKCSLVTPNVCGKP